MYIAMYGCDGYPAGYPFTTRGVACTDPVASGWLGAFLLLFIIIFGAYVLPTVLIGIVAISFDEATRRSNNMQVSVLGGAVQRSGVVLLESFSGFPKKQH
jgi:hypothetical protein